KRHSCHRYSGQRNDDRAQPEIPKVRFAEITGRHHHGETVNALLLEDRLPFLLAPPWRPAESRASATPPIRIAHGRRSVRSVWPRSARCHLDWRFGVERRTVRIWWSAEIDDDWRICAFEVARDVCAERYGIDECHR